MDFCIHIDTERDHVNAAFDSNLDSIDIVRNCRPTQALQKVTEKERQLRLLW